MLVSLGARLAYLSRVVGAVRIALERAEVRRSIPPTSVQRVEEGRVDSKHGEGLSQHLTCTCIMLKAPCAEIPMLPKKNPRVSKVKSLCTREFAVPSRKYVPGHENCGNEDGARALVSGQAGLSLDEPAGD